METGIHHPALPVIHRRQTSPTLSPLSLSRSLSLCWSLPVAAAASSAAAASAAASAAAEAAASFVPSAARGQSAEINNTRWLPAQ